ncbi:MAG: thioredoxin [Clostridia bacterium]|nr:thioredoxin [Clostridia bacterium]
MKLSYENVKSGENIINNGSDSENNKDNGSSNVDEFIVEEEENKETNNEKESGNMEVLEMTNERFEEEVLKSEKTVLIDFYADWCGPCKMMAPVVERVASENEDLKVVKVNIDNEEELAIKYMVMSIPTLVVIKNGEEVNRIVGLVDKPTLESIIK